MEKLFILFKVGNIILNNCVVMVFMICLRVRKGDIVDELMVEYYV